MYVGKLPIYMCADSDPQCPGTASIHIGSVHVDHHCQVLNIKHVRL